LPLNVFAAEEKISGYIGTEARLFPQSPSYDEQRRNQASFLISPEYYVESDDRKKAFTAELFYRADSADSDRTHFDVREFNYLHVGDSYEAKFGVSKVFWGVTESRHLVDIINQTDSLESADGEEKLGQQMVELKKINDWGIVSAYILPGFRERQFLGAKSRLRTATLIDNHRSTYESSQKEKHVDYALRYSQAIGDFDIGVAHFYGTSREARLVLKDNKFVPHYELINQTSLDLQGTFDALLLKLEAAYIEDAKENIFASVAGFEYSSYGIFDSSADLGYIYEHLYDNRGKTLGTSKAVQQNDSFAAIRLTFNDIASSELLAGFTVDNKNYTSSFLLEFSKRVFTNSKIEITAQSFFNVDEQDFAYNLRRDDYVEVRFLKYF
jgi:hypothetical protein